jgi:hypothetical protein
MNAVETPDSYQMRKFQHAKELAKKHELILSDQETHWIVYRKRGAHVVKLGEARTIDALVALLYKCIRTTKAK